MALPLDGRRHVARRRASRWWKGDVCVRSIVRLAAELLTLSTLRAYTSGYDERIGLGRAIVRTTRRGQCVSSSDRLYLRHEADATSHCVVASHPVPIELRPWLQGWFGFEEVTQQPRSERRLPAPAYALVIEFGSALGCSCAAGTRRFRSGFVVGPRQTHYFTLHEGRPAAICLSLTLAGVRALFGVQPSELVDRVVDGTCLIRDAPALAARLAEAPDWSARFRVAQALVERCSGAEARVDRGARIAEHAQRRIADSHGQIRVRTLCSELDVSRKHLNVLFARHVGLSPKRYARLVRFHRLCRRLEREPDARWSALAFDLGFSDQAHLARESREFAGVSATELRALLAESHG